MKFTSTVAILAVAAGVQAAKRAEPPVHARADAAATAAAGTGAAATAIATGTQPIVTGVPVPANNGTTNGTVPISSSAVHTSIAVIPSNTRSAGAAASSSAGAAASSSAGAAASSSAGAGTGAGGVGGGVGGVGGSNTPASPSATGFNPTNAGANIHPMGVAGAIVGGAAYGLMLL